MTHTAYNTHLLAASVPLKHLLAAITITTITIIIIGTPRVSP